MAGPRAMDVVGRRGRRGAARGEPVAPRTERRVSGPVRRRYRRGARRGGAHARRAAMVGARVRRSPRVVGRAWRFRRSATSGASRTTGTDGGDETALRGLTALGHALDDATGWARRRRTERARCAARPHVRRSRRLQRPPLARDESGVVLYQGDSALAWAGVIRPQLDLSRHGASIIAIAGERPVLSRACRSCSGAATGCAVDRRAARRGAAGRPSLGAARASRRRRDRVERISVRAGERFERRAPRCCATPSRTSGCSTCAPRRSCRVKSRSTSPNAFARAPASRSCWRSAASSSACGAERAALAARRRAGDGARVHGARSAQSVLESHAAVRSRGLLHATRRSAHGKCRRAGDDERARPARRARRVSTAVASTVALGPLSARSFSSPASGRSCSASWRAAFRFRRTESTRRSG